MFSYTCIHREMLTMISLVNHLSPHIDRKPNPEAMMKTSPDGSKRYFFMPFPQEDVVFNPNLGSNVDGVHVDVRATYSY